MVGVLPTTAGYLKVQKMEKLKPLSDVAHPDERNLMFVRMDTLEPSTPAEHHAEIAAIVLKQSVPEDVRSYFATIQNACLYCWFAYDLYALCCRFSSAAVSGEAK